MSKTPTPKKSNKTNLKLIGGWVFPSIKKEFVAKAKAHGHTESSLVGLLVAAFLKQNAATEELPLAADTKDAKFTFYLAKAEKVELKNRARERGFSPSAYMRSMLRAHLSKQPHFNHDELTALREANRQLAAIGKNINQIAKAINITPENAHLAASLDLIQVRALVEQHRSTVVSLVRENMKSWGVEQHEHVDEHKEE